MRQTEALVRRWRKTQATDAASTARSRVDPETDALAESPRRSLGTKVTLKRTKRGRGSMTIHFYRDEAPEGLPEPPPPAGR